MGDPARALALDMNAIAIANESLQAGLEADPELDAWSHLEGIAHLPSLEAPALVAKLVAQALEGASERKTIDGAETHAANGEHVDPVAASP